MRAITHCNNEHASVARLQPRFNINDLMLHPADIYDCVHPQPCILQPTPARTVLISCTTNKKAVFTIFTPPLWDFFLCGVITSLFSMHACDLYFCHTTHLDVGNITVRFKYKWKMIWSQTSHSADGLWWLMTSKNNEIQWYLCLQLLHNEPLVIACIRRECSLKKTKKTRAEHWTWCQIKCKTCSVLLQQQKGRISVAQQHKGTSEELLNRAEMKGVWKGWVFAAVGY